nr:hypothetical protein [Alistipes sp.]
AIDKGLLRLDNDRVVSVNYTQHPAEPAGYAECAAPTVSEATPSAPTVSEATLMPLPEPISPQYRLPHDEWADDCPF